ncbi:MAG: hypothetical protein KDC98_04530, partial [Planctomycetes bacterium]|nr:hypothetical protein [Planctomycetota bacterium]
MAQAPGVTEFVPFSTFDHTTTPGSPADLDEGWADAKAPGNGSVYLTGSIEVVDTNNNPTYSHVGVLMPTGLTGFNTLPFGGFKRQVAIIQQSFATGGGIQRQVYYYGFSLFSSQELPGLHTNVRAISVWPAASDAATRIAICGETSDQLLPLSQNTTPTNSTSTAPIYSGFIAVFDGAMNLLWSHHLFGRDPYGHCAATDVSIRVENGADIVTYCGISTHGVELDPTTGLPSPSNGPLTPVAWFTWPSPTGVADGASDNGTNQWDGFVGRLSNPISQVGAEVVQFHSVVGGVDQDGLFGLAELPDDRFVAVGSTASSGNPGSGTLAFPFTLANQLTAGVYCMGTALIFDPLNASATSRLEASVSIGTGYSATEPVVSTVARDVLVHIDGITGSVFANPNVPPAHAIHVVGSTDDPLLFSSVVTNPTPTAQTLLNTTGTRGHSDGFLLSARDDPGAGLVQFQKGSFHGGNDNDALHGVAAWNEHKDHVTVFGRTERIIVSLSDIDLEVATYFLDTPNGTVGQVSDLIRLRRDSILATSDQVPTAMGDFNVTTGVLPAWDDHGTGSPAGGGACVEKRGRITIGGRTDATSSYYAPARPGLGGDDAIRTDVDPLPTGPLASNGIGRTDGTGLGLAIAAGATGGTTPAA